MLFRANALCIHLTKVKVMTVGKNCQNMTLAKNEKRVDRGILKTFEWFYKFTGAGAISQVTNVKVA